MKCLLLSPESDVKGTDDAKIYAVVQPELTLNTRSSLSSLPTYEVEQKHHHPRENNIEKMETKTGNKCLLPKVL